MGPATPVVPYRHVVQRVPREVAVRHLQVHPQVEGELLDHLLGGGPTGGRSHGPRGRHEARYSEWAMDESADTTSPDPLWDPDARRRAILAMTPSERADLMADLCRQAAIFDTLVVRR